VRYLIWRALRKTLKSQRELARELGASQATISQAIRLAGEYKQMSPDFRGVAIRVRRRMRVRERKDRVP